MPAIFFGSISTLVDTSELQRRAFNEAFAAHGLDWNWSREDYVSMLDSNGGAQRVADYAASRGEDVDAAAVHATKSQIFRELLGDAGVSPRAGVVETLEKAKSDGFKLGFVTTTSPENVSAVLSALAPQVTPASFDLIVDSTTVGSPKPDAASYLFALDTLGVDATQAVAIEDNVGGVTAATGAGIACIAFPNENTAGGDFGAATEQVGALDAAQVVALV